MEEPTIDQILAEAETRIRKALFWSIPLLLLTISIPILALYGLFLPEGETISTWFQRSGSLMVIFSLWVEYELFGINGDVFPSGIYSGQEERLAERYRSKVQIVKYLAVVGALTGTVIWGYGDLLWQA